jgi:hypothetical protein
MVDRTDTRPSGTDKEPYFAALVASSWMINATVSAYFGGRRTFDPRMMAREPM